MVRLGIKETFTNIRPGMLVCFSCDDCSYVAETRYELRKHHNDCHVEEDFSDYVDNVIVLISDEDSIKLDRYACD